MIPHPYKALGATREAMIAGCESGPKGHATGRDPRHMTAAELHALGNAPMLLRRVIRAPNDVTAASGRQRPSRCLPMTNWFTLAADIHCRHMTTSQRAMIAAQLAMMRRDGPSLNGR